MNHPKSKLGLKPTFRKILVFAIASLLLAVPAHASNEAGPYFTLTGSIDTFEDTTLTNVDPSISVTDTKIAQERGLGFNHSIGYQFKNSFSAELEFSYKDRDFRGVVDGDMASKSFIANGIYSFNIREFYTPYVGYGIGCTFHEVNLHPSEKFHEGFGSRTDTTLAYQLKMGVDMEFSRKLSLLVGYRYFTSNNPDFKGWFSGIVASHGIEAGVKFHF